MLYRLLAITPLIWASGRAAELPMRVFTYADGLPRSNVQCIHTDSRGFLWLCTADGLTRYDGYRFDTMRVADGLPRRQVTSVVETRGGILLAGTLGGIARAPMPRGGKMPEHLSAIPVEGSQQRGTFAMLESRSGGIWAGTYGGLYRIRDPEGASPKAEFVDFGEGISLAVTGMAEDVKGTLWMATTHGVWRMPRGGRPAPALSLTRLPVAEVMVDRHGVLWVAGAEGLLQVSIAGTAASIEFIHGKGNGLAGSVAQLFESRDGRLWAGTSSGLSEWIEERHRWRSWDAVEGIPGWGVGSLGEDCNGNLWVGADHGLARLSREGFSTITAADGVGPKSISTILEHGGRLHAITNELDGPRILTLNNGAFTAARPRYAAGLKSPGWGSKQRALVDRSGAWWIATGDGLYRFPPGAAPEDLPASSAQIFLPGAMILRIFEDHGGSVWVAPIAADTTRGAPLWRWTPENRKLEIVAIPGAGGYINTFAEDRSGSLWMALSNDVGTNLPSALLRYRQGRFDRFTGSAAGGLDSGWITDLLADQSGALWVATSEKGLLRAPDPTLARPSFAPVGTKLANDVITCLAQGPRGRVLAAGPRGLESIEPLSGAGNHWTVAQGYPPGDCAALLEDSTSAIWAGTSRGLARMEFERSHVARPPIVYLTAFHAGGKDLSSQLGVPGAGMEMEGATGLDMEYVSPDAISGSTIRYRYRLLGADDNWSAPVESRSVRYGRLLAGHYQFQVKAVSESGQESQPAVLAFQIPQPFWRRTWFLALAGLASAAAIGAVEWIRNARRAELERMRARIAADLHDDMGAGLSRIAILSETLQLREGADRQSAPLRMIAESSREMVKSMGDIVWAVDPKADNWGSLASRLRELCGPLFDPRGIGWSVELDRAMAGMPLLSDRRRHLYLIVKEAMTNAARHSGATMVAITLKTVGEDWLLTVEDNGRGFQMETVEPGNGLSNLHYRARELRGNLRIQRAGNGGTLVVCTVPAHPKTGHGIGSWIRFE